MPIRENHCCRIVLTGGPGGGKTTAADLFRREIGESVVVVSEAFVLGRLPPIAGTRCGVGRAALHLSRSTEISKTPRPLCFRTASCSAIAAPWTAPPTGRANRITFFNALGTTLDHELARYDAVIFFETAAAGDLNIESGNPVRQESNAEAVTLDRKLRTLWLKHPRFVLVPHNP